MTCFNFFQKGVKAGTIEVRTAVPIVRKMPDISHAMLTGIFFKVHFLERDLSRGNFLLTISLFVLTSLSQGNIINTELNNDFCGHLHILL